MELTSLTLLEAMYANTFQPPLLHKYPKPKQWLIHWTTQGLGASETTIGLKKLAGEFAIDTKAATGIAPGAGQKILEFAKESLEALQTNKVNQAYMHLHARLLVRF